MIDTIERGPFLEINLAIVGKERTGDAVMIPRNVHPARDREAVENAAMAGDVEGADAAADQSDVGEGGFAQVGVADTDAVQGDVLPVGSGAVEHADAAARAREPLPPHPVAVPATP